ncbi:MAG: helix-turn-helix domain-containing protein [Rubrobacteraceae bacterium]|jgi:predicted RNase H-like HicB family nuclease/DNA-binding Xre family transcriptional regulator|nr:helix-turn-helix domain-containing protein [Rubrobacteraceae bacterium]
MEHIGEAIRHYRERRSMSKSELARRSHIDPGSVVRLESGEVRNPRINTVLNLAVALEVDPQELLQFIMGSPTMTEHIEASGPFTAVYEHTEDGWWVVSVPEIPGAHSQGKTLEEAREMIRDATRMLLEVRREDAQREAEGREVIREPLAL